jgi:hypothetical protein
MTPLSRAKELARKVHDESHTLTSPAFYEAVMALQSAVLALPEPAPVREGWQPIETAPKSHRMSVLLLRNDCVTVGWWDGQLTHRRPKPYWHTERGYLFGVEHDRLHQPTHWMPLPSEPRS